MQQRSVKKSGAFGWYFQRVTGVAIVILFIGHFWVQHMPTDALSDKDEYEMIREAYKNKYPDYKKAIEEGKISEAKEGEHLITYEKVTARLSNPVWKVFNILFLVFGLYHGFNGIFNIIDDYIRNRPVRIGIISITWVLIFLLLIQGSLTIITAGVYQPPIGIENIIGGMN